MSRQLLSAAARHFFDKILPAATQGKRLSQLSNRPENVQVLLGAYRKHTGGPVQRFGRPITPEFMLKAGNAPLPVQNSLPNLGEAPVAADASDQPLIWMRFAADAKVDDQAAIQDLMGDLDTYASRKFDLAGVTVQLQEDLPIPPNSSQWAAAIQANRGALPDNLSSLTAVPEPFRAVATDLASFKLTLSHFFTYDSTGAYYPKWTGAGRQIPADLSDKYKEESVREVKLERNELYVYMLVPKSLFTSVAAEAHDYREAVIRLDPTGEDETPFLATLVHSVYRRVQTPAPFYDFVVFEAEDGTGLAISADVRPKISASVLQFLISIPDVPDDRARFFHESTHVVEGQPPLVHLSAAVTGEPAMPEGALIEVAEGGMAASVMSPVDKIIEIAALPQVRYLDLAAKPYFPQMDLARAAIAHQDLRAKQVKQDGEGVLVGIIDTGIDGSHPAFFDAAGNTRIIAVWDQDDGANGNPNSPKAKHAGNKAYKMFDFGRERTGADVAGSTDKNVDPGAGHGTHVTGIAAGREVTGPSGNVPAGIASKAQIVVVKAIGGTQGVPELALSYIFQKAKELSKPCVVNMSFTNQSHAHDGTDQFALLLTRQIRDASGKYLPGRILVAAAGNDRQQKVHVGSGIAPNGSTTIRYVNRPPAIGGAVQISDLNVWIKGTKTGPKPNLRVTAQHIGTGWSTGALTPAKAVQSAVVPGLGLRINMVYGDRDIRNKDFNLHIGFDRPAALAANVEEWRIVIANVSKTPLDLHAWVVDSTRGALAGLVAEDNVSMVGSPASSRDVISVACAVTRLEWPDRDAPAILRNYGQTRMSDISNFSSQGPLRPCSEREITLFGMAFDQSHDAVTITAPGSAILSARASNVPIPLGSQNRQYSINDLCWMMQGTSMAAPVVTGLVACVLAENPNLTQEDIRKLIEGAGRLPDPAATNFNPGAPDVEDWGKGLIHAPALKP